MKHSLKHILSVGALALMLPAAMSAQTRTGYFLDDYTYRYQMNPAMDNARGFFAFPAIGNLNLGVNGSLGVSDVIYNVNGRTTTFMNPGVSAAEVMSHVKDSNRFGLDFNTPIIAFGFKGIGGYNTFTLSTVANVDMKIPGSVFSLLKEGITNKTYDIGNIDALGSAYVQLAIGHSHRLTDEIRIGATLKALVGAGRVKLDMEHADLELGTDSWRVVTEGEVHANVKGLTYKTDINNTTGHRYVNGVDVDGAGPAGYGAAVDLGVVYSPKFLPGLKLSASVIDLGAMKWNNDVVASTQGQHVFTTDKYTFNVDKDAPNSFDNEWEKIKDEISALYELANLGDQGTTTTTLGATINVGAEYALPVYKALRFGVLGTTRMAGDYSWTDFRLSAAWVPCKVFDVAVSGGAGTFGASVGWLVNLHCPGFNLFVGMDNLSTKLSKIGVPLRTNNSVNLGVNFLF